MLQTTTSSAGAITRLTATRGWDTENRLKTMTNVWTGGSQSRDTTLFDARSRRKTIAWDDGSKWDYGKNDRGEVLAGGRTWNDAAAVSGHQYGYTFDNIGNRTTATVNGRGASYLPNSLNQLTQRTVPGAVDLIGTAAATATGTASVTVNGAATARHGSYFYKEVTTTNNSAAQDVAMETSAVLAGGTTSRMQHAFVPKTPEVFNHDEDGNLKIDGRFTYTWDAENRLVAMESPASVPAAHRRKLAFAYDAQGRRIRKQVWHWVEGSQGAWVLHHVLKMAYDGWNLVAELTEGGQPVRSYAWGEDVSGTLQGAGGVGGLLFEQVHYGGKTLAAGYDLNGNVTAMVDMATGNPAAQYEYGPFGELIRASGEFAELNPFRFSTKYQDGESGLLYYGYRYYNPVTGRWLSRDPIGEEDCPNMFAFVRNNGVNGVDVLGSKELFLFDGETRTREEMREIDSAIAFDVIVGLGANATADGVTRALYNNHERTLQQGLQKLREKGVLSSEQASRLYHANRNLLVTKYQEYLSGVSKLLSQAKKGLGNFPSYEQVLAKRGGNHSAVLDQAKTDAKFTRNGARLRAGGSVCLVLGVGNSFWQIANAPIDERGRVIAEEAGSFGGAVAGAWSFSRAGLWVVQAGRMSTPAGIATTFAFSIAGSILGGQAGSNGADLYYDIFVND